MMGLLGSDPVKRLKSLVFGNFPSLIRRKELNLLKIPFYWNFYRCCRPQGVTVHILCTESWFEIGDNLTANLRFARHPPSAPVRRLYQIPFGAALLDQVAHESLLWPPKPISLRWYEGARAA
jgi:hypothetical protein